jgi:hypothetical protein
VNIRASDKEMFAKLTENEIKGKKMNTFGM